MIVAVQCEAMVDTLRQHNHVSLSTVYPDPSLVKVAYIKVPCIMLKLLTLADKATLLSNRLDVWMECWQFEACGYSTGNTHRTTTEPSSGLPLPSRTNLISSSVCMCSSKKDLIFCS